MEHAVSLSHVLVSQVFYWSLPQPLTPLTAGFIHALLFLLPVVWQISTSTSEVYNKTDSMLRSIRHAFVGLGRFLAHSGECPNLATWTHALLSLASSIVDPEVPRFV